MLQNGGRIKFESHRQQYVLKQSTYGRAASYTVASWQSPASRQSLRLYRCNIPKYAEGDWL